MLISFCIVTAADAQQSTADPFEATERTAEDTGADTDYTPVAKESDHWLLVGGARFGKTDVVDGSPTSFDTNLFAVAFRGRKIGLAGGSACPEQPTQRESESDADFARRVADCGGGNGQPDQRVPTLYRYVAPPDGDPRWQPLELPAGDKPGYIGGIGWIDARRALIVGGTGTYPRRELGHSESDQFGRSNAITDPTDPDKADVAGKARAWLYDAEVDAAHELDLSGLTEDEPERAGMRGLTSAECAGDGVVAQEANPIELCLAGALGQIWEWRDGEFTGERLDAQTPAHLAANAASFRYRVRDIDFVRSSGTQADAFAATSGCCGPTELDNYAVTISFDSSPSNGAPSWQVRGYRSGQFETGVNTAPELPDSFYSINAVHSSFATVVATPGGPPSPSERPSMISSNNNGYNDVLLQTRINTARLVAGDTDSTRAVPDWAVGELRSTRRDELGARGIAVAAESDLRSPYFLVDAVNVSAEQTGSWSNPDFKVRPTPDEAVGGWEPVDQKKVRDHIASRAYFLPSYTANAVDVIGADEDDGWAVGDRGAILRLAKSQRQSSLAASEPPRPTLGQRRRERFADDDPYDSGRPPVASAAGIVPSLGPKTISLDEPRMVPAGFAAGAIERIVMSRDGGEGVAVGEVSKPAADGGVTTIGALFHFDGSRWSRCHPSGIEGASPPDPACAAMAPIEGYATADGGERKLSFVDIERLPLENDSDPTNDDEFEVVAITNTYSGPEAQGHGPPGQGIHMFARFHEGRWEFVEPAEGQEKLKLVNDAVFTAPDDGWVLQEFTSGSPVRLMHFDGERWMDCRETPVDCGDPDGRLPRPVSSEDDLGGLAAAGDRVYLYGARRVGEAVGGVVGTGRRVPLILYRDRDEIWTDGSKAGGDRAGLDPGFQNTGTDQAGMVRALTVVQTNHGGFEGWAVGEFASGASVPGSSAGVPPDAALLRLEGTGGWRRFRSPGAFEDYMIRSIQQTGETPSSNGRLIVSYPSAQHPDGVFIGQEDAAIGTRGGRIFAYNSTRRRFEILDSARPQGVCCLQLLGEARPAGDLQSIASDGRGGFWSAVGSYFFHFTDRAPAPVFEEVPNPLGIRNVEARDIAAGSDGSVWLASGSNRVFRYDRQLGWMATTVPGWDAGRVVTRPSKARALAVGPTGDGLLVGEEGRIATLSDDGVLLDPAAGTSCGLGDPPPCGSSRDLTAVDITSDGSAITGGERLTLLWRPSGGGFRAIAGPRLPSSTNIEAISYPAPDHAYVATDNGAIYRGSVRTTGEWRWELDAKAKTGSQLLDPDGTPFAIRDVAVKPSGHGYAVGDRGVVLERSGDGVWRQIQVPAAEDLTSVEFAQPTGDGVLIGGKGGIILTGRGSDFDVARPGDFPNVTGAVAGFAYMPGSSDGSVDAWAAIAPAPNGKGDSRLLRYRSDPADPLIDPTVATKPLADVPSTFGADISIAAFGKSDCEKPESELCPEMSGTTTTNEVVTGQIVDELSELRDRGKIDLALMSGDATDSAGLPASSLANLDRSGAGENGFLLVTSSTQTAGELKHRRFSEMVVDRIEQRGVPIFGAIGGQDLSEAYVCNQEGHCDTTKQAGNAGENYSWREALDGRSEPWGDGRGSIVTEGDVELRPVRGSDDGGVRVEDHSADLDGDGGTLQANADIGGAATHYALDAMRDGEPVARIVFVDTSLGSLSASDPLQQPTEPGGGQTRFLERMICRRGETTSTGDECTRGKDQAAIVVSNTPTYSYGPGAFTHTATDANVFEALILKHDVNLVISGALGFNGLYYTLAPGVHEPCPGDLHPAGPPDGELPSCVGGASAVADQLPAGDPRRMLEEQGLSGAVPTLIASGAGGKFGPDGSLQADGPAGQWHGYSVARLQSEGGVTVEQRPLLDWIGLDAPRHVVHAKDQLGLTGYGRSPISTTTEGGSPVAFHYEISSAAITHRYDLLLADPGRPWLPCEDSNADCRALHTKLSVKPGEPVPTSQLASADEPANASADDPCAPYLCLPKRIATVDRLSGEVKAGDGKYPETFAVAMLSVEDKVATYPLVFKPSPSFVVTPFEGPPQIPANAQPAAPPPPSLPKPQIPSLTLPTPPTLPTIPPLVAATPPEPAPPAPPAPPPPADQPQPLNLSVAPTGLTVATPTAVIQPPTPPVNPAPPGGARREARQRQAAAQKSGADAESEAREGGGDLADGPPIVQGSEMSRYDPAQATRRDPQRAVHSFTPLARADQPSAWTTGALYGGGVALMAFALAAAWMRGRPTPRRRTPDLAVPAWSRAGGRRRR